METNRMVHHDGTVIECRENMVKVKIISLSACAECHAKSMCNAADMQEKIIDAFALEPLKEGDEVTLQMEEKLGWIALFYGFILPFIVLVCVLFTTHLLGGSEIQSGLLGLGSLVPYYLGLYVFRKKIEKDFVFKAEKKNN
ncbi:MAG: SoxR reducing system RseC family protein [bacterium]|nr:SoxR reducing system RseC family protein [bacterium]